jgi:hypothetical protein
LVLGLTPYIEESMGLDLAVTSNSLFGLKATGILALRVTSPIILIAGEYPAKQH